MKPATWPRPEPLDERLLHVDPDTDTLTDHRVSQLAELLRAGDALIVNDAATIPASFHTRSKDLELRLLSHLDSDRRWRALLFGPGDHRTPTERRPAPRRVASGERLDLGDGLSARITDVDASTPRIVDIELEQSGAALLAALYRNGRLIQYAHVERPLALWHVQSHFASRPWAVEPPSAGRPLSFRVLLGLRARGVRLGWLTHAAGVSSTGCDVLDARLPLDERFLIPTATVGLIRDTQTRGGRVVAAGTTVVRALESRALEHGGPLEAGEGLATLRIGPGFVPRIVDGLLTGMHERGTSHFTLLEAFAPTTLLERSLEHATAAGYLQHELGDSCLILGSSAGPRRRPES